MFITFEGIEGSGKSTQAEAFAKRLGKSAVFTREPGGTRIGQLIRAVLLDPSHERMAAATEALLYFADRAQHVSEVVRPALAAGRIVVSDRYVDSSLAYQVQGRGLAPELVHSVFLLATGGLMPKLTFLLHVPVEVGLARIAARGGRDRLESEVVEFHERVHAAYLAMAGREPERFVSIDGAGAPDEVAARVAGAAVERGLRLVG